MTCVSSELIVTASNSDVGTVWERELRSPKIWKLAQLSEASTRSARRLRERGALARGHSSPCPADEIRDQDDVLRVSDAWLTH